MADFDPTSVDLTSVDAAQVICFLDASGNEYDGRLGARISAIFVILVTSSVAALFPVMATHLNVFRLPLYVYLFARYFGAGVIIATAFIHLLDPAYEAIGPASCVGMTGNWAQYTWPPALALTSCMLTFLLEFLAEWYVEKHYRLAHSHDDAIQNAITTAPTTEGGAIDSTIAASGGTHLHLHTADQDNNVPSELWTSNKKHDEADEENASGSSLMKRAQALAFREQFAAFLVLEFGVVFHSVIIGLNLGVVGNEFNTLYPVIVFHQTFEGLGIGARLSAIPFPSNPSRLMRWLPWALCLAYGLTTPLSIAIGLGVRTTYNSGSFTANTVSGVLDSISAGILLYTGLVELLARDFLFNPDRSRDSTRVAFMLVCLFLGIIIMALLGKWA